ncbi:MAG: hypothetical protein JWM98_3352 [Thermoleophilia bacterium]|nr:hypothetical protein [Thermoleophilia bacterium]
MTEGIGTGRRIDLGAAIAPEGRALAPHTVSLVESDAAAHDRLVHAAYTTLGEPGDRPLDPWSELARMKAVDRAAGTPAERAPATQALLARGADSLRVDLGSTVVLPQHPFDPELWTVTGVGGTDGVQLHRAIDGAVQHRSVQWPELLSANPSLAEHWRGHGPIVARLREMRPPAGAPPSQVDLFELHQVSTPPGERLMEVVLPGAPERPELVVRSGTWSDLAGRLGLARLQPLGALPSDAWNAANLVNAATPTRRIVMAADAQAFIGQALLVGTETIDPAHRAAPDTALLEDISHWFGERGLPTWRDPADAMLLSSGDPDSIANASASGQAEFVRVLTGPRDPEELRELTSIMDPETAHRLSSSQELLTSHWRAVLAHEVGHTATQQLWGIDASAALRRAVEAQDLPTVARLAEHDIAGEAFSDLFGAAYTDSASVGARELGLLGEGSEDLDALRATIARAGRELDVHVGTQLLTKPMLAVQDAHGSEAMADVAASAAKQLGAMLGRGEIEAIDLPVAATALRDAAAMRWGLEDGLVQGLTKAWQGLRLLR